MGQTASEARRELIDESAQEISLRRQCELLGVNRSVLYYETKPLSVDNVEVLNVLRDVWMRYPFYGYRRLTKELQSLGMNVNHKRVQRLMFLGGIRALYPGPNTSKRNKEHLVHPYLLNELEITKPNQVWQVDITYLRMGQGFMYLVAIIDVYSRYIVSWSLSNTLETSFCIEALNMGLMQVVPEIINSDQGCQFTRLC